MQEKFTSPGEFAKVSETCFSCCTNLGTEWTLLCLLDVPRPETVLTSDLGR